MLAVVMVMIGLIRRRSGQRGCRKRAMPHRNSATGFAYRIFSDCCFFIEGAASWNINAVQLCGGKGRTRSAEQNQLLPGSYKLRDLDLPIPRSAQPLKPGRTARHL